MGVFKRYQIRHIFFTSFFAFMLLAFIVIISVSYRYSVNEMVQATTEYQEQLLTLLSNDISNYLQSYDDISVGLSRQSNFRQALKGSEDPYTYNQLFQSLSRDLSNIVYSVPGLHSIEVYLHSPPHSEIQQPINYLPLEAVEEMGWTKRLDGKNSVWIGERVSYTMAGEERVLSLARNVFQARGEIEGVLVLNVHASTIETWLKQKSQESNLMIIDKQGRFVATSDPQHESVLYSPYFDQYLPYQPTMQTGENDKDEDALEVSMPIPNTEWTLKQVTPYSELTEGSRRMAAILVIIGAIMIVVALLVTYSLTKKFTTPIYELKNVLSKYPDQDLSGELPSDYRNEFGELFEGYKGLIRRNNELYRSLHRQYKRQREAEIKALQANINPHFLYNTLDQLNWMAIEKGDRTMSHMLENLGQMLRIGLSNGESILPLEKEVEYLKYYLKIQKLKMGERLTYTVDVPVMLYRYLIPKLTLQPFVENCFIHGFQDGRDGEVVIRAMEDQNHIVMTIQDNGIGFQPVTTKRSKLDMGGYGIRNVMERLDVYFDRYASVHVTGDEQGGTLVKIIIPKVLNKERLLDGRSITEAK
ncbi:sensor histidine kinase [Halalkalibacterium halodurans]|jgi:two-component system sensor histidine kinase YesM|uniref:BH1122 protein n=2 Tax=Halalkalibacterium halodurans TaxID=86665 RepID=Q9KDT9_HALH5|nr:sensor histidine kinase [Halalkalibacterium halodurans]MDY7221654.1 sensor histidine kinase [Halalkalibacterium halodurans]MDY7240930.1 sensor histidine kinase [Halalkalibacterium halodurans]MED3645501.1 sensor histidine kinase [Halalkalibacterium halodurans]MED4079325.1 sensor histidine kinase [Halalkalibacterium halodurans]MED4085396.1 sensor histidine kinase [Halalkalibacterium halodurans]